MKLRCIMDGLELEGFWEMGKLILRDGEEVFSLQKQEAGHYEVFKASIWEWQEILRQGFLNLRWAADYAPHNPWLGSFNQQN